MALGTSGLQQFAPSPGANVDLMCGRYAASTHPDKLIEIFEVDDVPEGSEPAVGPDGLAEWSRPRWNIAPTDPVPAVLERAREGRDVRLLTGLRWGLVPSWSKDATGGARMINARLETVASKPAFRKAFAARRCLLPADGYYEWQPLTAGGRSYKQPWFIRPQDGLMVMAGIYEFWRDPRAATDADGWLVSCSVITTSATDDLGRIHDRMPVQVPRMNWDAWLDPALDDAEAALGLLHVPSPGEMVVHPVSTRVNKVSNDGAELVAPIQLPVAGE